MPSPPSSPRRSHPSHSSSRGPETRGGSETGSGPVGQVQTFLSRFFRLTGLGLLPLPLLSSEENEFPMLILEFELFLFVCLELAFAWVCEEESEFTGIFWPYAQNFINRKVVSCFFPSLFAVSEKCTLAHGGTPGTPPPKADLLRQTPGWELLSCKTKHFREHHTASETEALQRRNGWMNEIYQIIQFPIVCLFPQIDLR